MEPPSSTSGGSATTSTSSVDPSLPPQQQQQHRPQSRYESQKRRDWNTFQQYLHNHKPPLSLPRCSGAHVIEFLKYLDQFGKTKVHSTACPSFGRSDPPPPPCACPLRQAWGSLDALIGRLRAAYEESGGRTESNPFAARAVRMYLREVREAQAKARGIPYEKRRRKRVPPIRPVSAGGASTSSTPGAAESTTESSSSATVTVTSGAPVAPASSGGGGGGGETSGAAAVAEGSGPPPLAGGPSSAT